MCCSPWGHKGSDTTEPLNNSNSTPQNPCSKTGSLTEWTKRNNKDKACLSLQGLDLGQASPALEWGRSRGPLRCKRNFPTLTHFIHENIAVASVTAKCEAITLPLLGSHSSQQKRKTEFCDHSVIIGQSDS